MMSHPKSHLALLPSLWLSSILLLSSALVLTACGDKKADKVESGKSETQVVAKVNGDEISIHQVNFQLGRMMQGNQAALNEEQSKKAAQQILARLVDQQILKQKALEAKLDREPRVLQALEASKNEILAQAYLEQMMGKAVKPTAAKIDTFYAENPELFEKRRVFRLQELVVDIAQDKHAEIANNIKALKNINEIATWLKDNKYPFNANSNVRAAEQLPLELLKKLQPLKDGEFITAPSGNTLNIVHIAASQTLPITREKATPIIEQYFLNQNKNELAKTEMLALNKSAKVEYVGAFADMKNNQTTTEAIKKSGAIKPSSQVAAPLKQSTAEKPKASEVNMDKGLAGL
jgi:EpsD family peptidyl-prolyl cis-trans isomerase